MSNPFLALGEDSDDDAPKTTPPPPKPATQVNYRKPPTSADHKPPRAELKKQEEGARARARMAQS